MAGTAEFSSASSAGVNCKAAAPVFSSICAIRDDEIRIHGRLDVLERLVMSGAAAAAQICSEVARPKRFELLTPRFVV